MEAISGSIREGRPRMIDARERAFVNQIFESTKAVQQQ